MDSSKVETSLTAAPLVSVIIPTFNRAYCLPRAIDSALAQTHCHLEIVVVDDGSKDDTRSVIEARYGHEPRVRYLYQDNTGVSGARNHGMAKCRGDFVALLDSDDLWFPWKIAAQLAVFEAFPEAGMVWTDMEAIDPSGKVCDPRHLRTMYSAYRWFTSNDLFDKSIRLADISPTLPDAIRGADAFVGDIYSPMIMGNLVHTSTVLMRRERMQQVGEFVAKYTHGGEDFHFHLRTCRQGPVAFLDAASIQYQLGFADQITRPESQMSFATSFLETIQTELANHRERIQLPSQMIRAVLSEAHSWIGEVALRRGDHALARRQFVRSLRHELWQPALWRHLLLAVLPPKFGEWLRSGYRQLRRVVSKGATVSKSDTAVQPEAAHV